MNKIKFILLKKKIINKKFTENILKYKNLEKY